MTKETAFDLIIIGSGPGGYVAAIRASQLGLKTAIIEKETLGGVCLNWGCIPSKALIHAAEQFSSIANLRAMGITVDTGTFDYEQVYLSSRKAAARLSKGVEFLMKKNAITVFRGSAAFTDANTVMVDEEVRLIAKNFCIATGSSPRALPGFDFDERNILSSTGALQMKTLPKRVAILGAGAIGVEFSYILSTFGVDVHLIEMLDQLLPLEDHETVEILEKSFRKNSIHVSLSTKALSCARVNNELVLSLQNPEGATDCAVDKIIVAVGRLPNSLHLGLEKTGVETEGGFIKVNAYYATAVPHIYAFGDVIKTPLLAHVASAEGVLAVEHIAGIETPQTIDYTMVPSAIYGEPSLASFGLTEHTATQKGLPCAKAVFPYRANGKAVAVEKIDGMVKIVYHKETREILGAHIAGESATEIIHELLLAGKASVPLEEIASMVHAHPSISEAIKEAAGSIEKKSIHI
jgi:dihydrolipoamide dehydrogenase